MTPSAGLPPPERKPHAGKVQRLGKRLRTYAGVLLPKARQSMQIATSFRFDDVESYGDVVSIEHARRRRFRKGKGMDRDEGQLRRVESWQNDRGEPKELGEAWRLVKNGRVTRCVLVGHPLGHEARIILDDEDLPITQVCKNTQEVADITSRWREGFISKGWK